MMSKQTTENEAIASEDWQKKALQLVADISQLSESITSAAQTGDKDSQMTQWVMKRGELIQNLLMLITSERITSLSPELSQSISEQIEAIQKMDLSVNQALKASMASIHQQLMGIQSGKKTLRGYHLSTGNQSEYTRSKDV